MSDNNELVLYNKGELLNVFSTEEDKNGSDVLAMSDFFSVFIDNIEIEMSHDSLWEESVSIEGLIGEITSAIKTGFDISDIGTLVADYSHFSPKIIEGLKSGKYHVGQSQEVNGNFRPGIFDENEHFVKHFTLKKAVDPKNVLNDVSTIAMHAAMQKISLQIEEVKIDIKRLNAFVRRESLSNPFIDARDKIKLAAMSVGRDAEEHLKSADTYLMEGLNSLYNDLQAQICNLNQADRFFSRITTLDEILSCINEDIQLILKYVGLRVYLFNYLKKEAEAIDTLNRFCYEMRKLTSDRIGNGKYTAVELIHRLYPYNDTNMDFWLTQPKQLVDTIGAYKNMLEQKEKEVYYIDDVEGSDER